MTIGAIPGRRTVAAVFVIVALGGWLLGMTGYNHGLPFVDFGDEMTMWTRGRALIDPAIQYFQPEYPPAMGWLLWAFQRAQIALGDTNYNASAAVAAGRITSVTAYALTGLLLMFAVWRMAERVAGRWAGLLGALAA
ncbi:MAG: hypothetical protein KC547_15590, partial [Anaerolineae bacterium]|nr:hypothetical protein [Anaerolineae bacterium]